jgi:hypothetical protein
MPQPKSGADAGRQPRPQDLRWDGGTTPTARTGVLGRQRVRLRNANLGNQCAVTGRLVVFTMVGQEPLRCPGPAWAAAAAR